MATKKAFRFWPSRNPPTVPSPHDARIEGMDLRDWFAGQAIAKASQILRGTMLDNEQSIARQAYAIADAMMEARGR